MKIVIAPDSFKGTIRAPEVCQIWKEVLAKEIPDAEVISIPMSDGGEGALEAVATATGAPYISCQVTDPLGRPITARYARISEHSAFVETAAGCGLELITREERNPMKTTTFGAGQLIAQAIRNGAREITVGIGGCATVDGGTGLLEALGFRFLDASGNEIPRGGEGLQKLARIDDRQTMPELKNVLFRVASDVTNPLLGATGAAAVFGPQKGATPDMVQRLENGLANLANVMERQGLADTCTSPGDGAAGGIGFTMRTLLKAKMMSGAHLIADTVCFEKKIAHADIVITGEGQTDRQTLFGKLPAVLAELAAQQHIPVILCSGAIQDAEELRTRFTAVFGTVQKVAPLDEVLSHARENLRALATSIATLLHFSDKKR